MTFQICEGCYCLEDMPENSKGYCMSCVFDSWSNRPLVKDVLKKEVIK